MSKYDDCHRVDNRYTTAIGMSVWRFFNVGKYKNQKVNIRVNITSAIIFK